MSRRGRVRIPRRYDPADQGCGEDWGRGNSDDGRQFVDYPAASQRRCLVPGRHIDWSRLLSEAVACPVQGAPTVGGTQWNEAPRGEVRAEPSGCIRLPSIDRSAMRLLAQGL